MAFDTPLVSVLMPVYNAELYLHEAIQSILCQTFADFEFLIFDDGSTDASKVVIQSFTDERIVFINHIVNKGLVATLNDGLLLAKGKYIARMDNDDIARPERLAKQVAFMESHLEVGVCGTAFQTFGSRNVIADMPVKDADIREFMLVYNPLGHPTVMMRKSVIVKYRLCYRQDYTPAEDFRMWYDFSQVTELANLPDVLLDYRTHEKQMSSSMNAAQRNKVNEIRWLQLQNKGFQLNDEEILLYCCLLDSDFIPRGASDLLSIQKLMKSIVSQNEKICALQPDWIEKLLSNRWSGVISKIKNFTPQYIIPLVFLSGPTKHNISNFDRVRFLFKSLLFWKQ